VSSLGLVLFAATAMAGIALVVAGLSQAHSPVADPAEYLRDLDRDDFDVTDFEQHLALPFMVRVVRPLGTSALDRVSGLLPRNHLDRVHHKLLMAGLSTTVRAEEFVTVQAVLLGLMSVAAIAMGVFGNVSPRVGIFYLVVLPGVGILAPLAWLNRKVSERKTSIFRDLPDVLDLLAISVEAGMGFEGALEIVCTHFTSPLAEEFTRTLKEMELGLPRRDALQNLKRRTEVPELSNFVLALTQADALGMPVGRVLKTQAGEMRNKRRAWAREKAGKLPVKIMFPLVLFIFPAVLVVILGPAASTTMKAFH
jgi:tight adherence protein C